MPYEGWRFCKEGTGVIIFMHESNLYELERNNLPLIHTSGGILTPNTK